MKKTLLIVGVALVLLGAVLAFAPGGDRAPAEPAASSETLGREVLAENLEVPWGIAFLPDGDILVSERPGTLVRIGQEGAREELSVQEVRQVDEGGLLGIALHPGFEENRFVYLYKTTPVSGGTENQVLRYRLQDAALTDETVIIEGISLPRAASQDQA